MAKVDNLIKVEVAYAVPAKQVIIPINVQAGATVKEAIQASGVLSMFEEIDIDKNTLGIFSKRVKLDHVLREMDRVEIYRPLITDPKEIRKLRAAQGKKMKKGT